MAILVIGAAGDRAGVHQVQVRKAWWQRSSSRSQFLSQVAK